MIWLSLKRQSGNTNMVPTNLFAQEEKTTNEIIDVQNIASLMNSAQDVNSSDVSSCSVIDKRKSTDSSTSNDTPSCSPRNSTLNPLKTFRF